MAPSGTFVLHPSRGTPCLSRRARRVETVTDAAVDVVELALVLPVVLLIGVVAIDFGRIYLGWVNLQNMARIAATYAANNPDGWPDDEDIQARYEAHQQRR